MRRHLAVAIVLAGVGLGVAGSVALARSAKSTPSAHAKKRGKTASTRTSKKQGSVAPLGKRPKTTSTAPADLPVLDVVIRCPIDMVAVGGRVCVDRYELALVDATTAMAWPPFFPPSAARARSIADTYEALRLQSVPGSMGRDIAIPEPPTWSITPRAISARDVTPQGYLSSVEARGACESAGKRLCTEAEWVLACRGEERRDFPYGDRYEQGACNVNRESHPSFLLHGNAARYHDDPRNSLVAFDGAPLLRATGATPRCVSKWGDDAIYDMVGNLDEWVESPRGVFVGGFYSRGTKSGCRSRVSAHPNGYSDYSTGSRCCSDPLP